MYKKCYSCKQEKLLSEFYKNKSRTDGYQVSCKSCIKDYQELNKDKISEYKKLYVDNNKAEIANYRRAYRKTNKLKITIQKKEYHRANKYKFSAQAAKRRASKLRATPIWLTEDQFIEIEEFYEIAQAFKLYTGQQYHVDHIIPLQGKNVCGLHVPWNLQILEASENLSKSNKLLED